MKLRIARVLFSRSENIILITGFEDNAPTYYYLKTNAVKKSLAMEIPQGKEIDFTLLGTVIERGYGEPNEFVQTKMREKFGFVPANN